MKISLCAFSYRKSYYMRHPLVFLREIWILVKNAWHRMRYGYAWVDLWNFDSYLGQMIPSALRELADRSCGFPGTQEFSSAEAYVGYLQALAWIFEFAHLEEVHLSKQPLEDKHSKYEVVERLYARAKIAAHRDEDNWQLELRKFAFEELGRASAGGLLWD